MQWFRPCSKPEPRVVHFRNPVEFTSLPPRTQAELCQWDDVTAMYRRSALLENPFRRVSFAEDVIWAKDALAKGHALVYEPRAQVCHYHYETFPFRFRRAYTIHYHLYRHFHYPPLADPVLRPLASCVYHLGKAPALAPLQKLRWIAYNVRLILAGWLATATFTLTWRLLGDRAVDLSHEYFCNKPPQPPKGGLRGERKQRHHALTRP
jgi:rhamnosyltransferase